MTDQQYAVVLVYSTSYALKVEKIIQGAGVECKLIPVPRNNKEIIVKKEDIEAA